MKSRRAYILCVIVFAFVGKSSAAPPRVNNDRYQLELIASDPQIVTPTGMAFDRKGRLLVIESNTHHRPKEYDGPPSDRIRMLSDSDGDGRPDRWSTYAEGFRHAMNILASDDDGLYVVERGRVILLHDTDGDGVADKQEVILRVETENDYPHNGLSGIARWGSDHLILGLGENHGLPYRLIPADGKEIAGTGGQDGFYKITNDGEQLERIARGVWNPFAICATPDGRIFAADNDPDSSPPCRLLHVVESGDYGYLYQYGRAGTHPLQAWNGELPGTLPFVCGVGEAPTAIVLHAGHLWVTSWGDHRIERYELVPRGASYGAKRDVIVQGNEDFRPTGMAVAPDGSLYFGDWVLRDYPVHGHGRIWRLALPAEEAKALFPPPTQEYLTTWGDSEYAYSAADSSDPFGHASAAWHIARENSGSPSDTKPGRRLCKLQAERFRGVGDPTAMLRTALADKSPEIRLYAVRWIADDRITALREDVARLLDGTQPDARYYLALLAAIDWLDREPKMRGSEIADVLLVRELENESRSDQTHALALTLLKPDNKFLTFDRLRQYLKSEHAQLRLEAVRTLAQQSDPGRSKLLAEVATDESQSEQVRAEAIAGLAPFFDQYPPATALRGYLESDNATLRREAERACRLAVGGIANEIKPTATDSAAWTKLMAKPGDAESGRRLYFSSVGPRCSNCHTFAGRGGKVGPDLTRIAQSATRDKIIASILQPSQEVAPDYQPWSLVTSDGKSYMALRLPKAGDDGKENYIDSNGTIFTLPSSEIEERHAADKSIMPDNLQSTLTIDDLRDLITFLTNP